MSTDSLDFPIQRLTFDAELWPRVERDDERVRQLADLLEAGTALPPVKIQRLTCVVLGGWHTVAAYQALGRETVPVEVVDVPEAERLLFAYREDVTAALPYTGADVRSVARRLYVQRATGDPDTPVNVAALAKDLGRPQQTVARWIEDLVAADAERKLRDRMGRQLAAHALVFGAGLAQRRVGALLGIDHKTVATDSQVAITPHVADERVVFTARGFLMQTAGRGSTPEERRAAFDWLLGQTDPAALDVAQIGRALTSTWEWTTSALRQLEGVQRDEAETPARVPACADPEIQDRRHALGRLLNDTRAVVDALRQALTTRADA